MTDRLPWKLAGLGALTLVAAAVAAGLAPGTDVPTIHIDAFNDNRGEFCVTCEAGLKPAMVAFVQKNDKTTRDLVLALDKAYKDNKSKRLYAGIVVLDGGGAQGLKQFVEREALHPGGDRAGLGQRIKKWQVDEDATRQAYFIVKHRVKTNAVDLGPATSPSTSRALSTDAAPTHNVVEVRECANYSAGSPPLCWSCCPPWPETPGRRWTRPSRCCTSTPSTTATPARTA
ncbi:MAG: hypothetical protein M5U09_22215 [Gammaproteobacteria bacterium]|nr:hypothetical protein [Gammaproteobacteria bacterium]